MKGRPSCCSNLQELVLMSPATVRSRRHLLLTGIDWRTYTRLLHVFAEHPSVRLAYDRGVLEIMSPLPEHESDADMLGRFVVVMTEELGLPIKAGRSTTFRRRPKRRGLEPDNSYWIATEPRVRGKRRINLKVDPPPDLAIEVDVTSSSLNRMGIYAALAVPEVWRLDGSLLTFHVLGAGGQYAESPHSAAFPLVTPSDLVGFMALRSSLDENTVVRRFREWFRQRLAAAGAGSAP
jgi:Uma2 family endonuclease